MVSYLEEVQSQIPRHSRNTAKRKRKQERKKREEKKKNTYFKTSQEGRLGNRSLEVAVCLKGFAGIR